MNPLNSATQDSKLEIIVQANIRSQNQRVRQKRHAGGKEGQERAGKNINTRLLDALLGKKEFKNGQEGVREVVTGGENSIATKAD